MAKRIPRKYKIPKFTNYNEQEPTIDIVYDEPQPDKLAISFRPEQSPENNTYITAQPNEPVKPDNCKTVTICLSLLLVLAFSSIICGGVFVVMFKEDFQQELDVLREQINACQKNTTLAKGTPVSQSVFFRASSPDNQEPGYGDTIKFADILVNKGDGYNKTTGVFTAPVTGNFLFTCQVCGYENHDIRFAFVQDGIEIQPFQLSDGLFSCGTATFITWLESGSKVWIKSIVSHSIGVLFEDVTTRNVFSGTIIY